jgi:hypothetical protein
VRSGSSALCLALQKGTRYRGFPEGHVLDVANRLIIAINVHFQKKDTLPSQARAAYQFGHITHARFQAETMELLRRLMAGYATPFWFDKTPTYQMVISVPLLAQAWPRSSFIFMKRRGLENICSRMRKFGTGNFREMCTDWAIIMSAWRVVRENIPGRFIELDQRIMLTEPDSVAGHVGRLLNLEPTEIEAFSGVLRRERPEMTDPSGSIVSNISQLGWSDEQMQVFRALCNDEMDAYGYTYDAQYSS